MSASDDGTARTWALPAGTARATLPGHARAVVGVAAASGRTLVTASADGTLRTFTLPGGRAGRTFAWSGAGATSLAAAGEAVVSGHADGTLVRWDLATGEFTLMPGPR